MNDEAPAIENLRVNSNYLTPKVGAMSADAWADVAMYLRNLLLNWFVMVPAIVFLVLGRKAAASYRLTSRRPHSRQGALASLSFWVRW